MGGRYNRPGEALPPLVLLRLPDPRLWGLAAKLCFIMPHAGSWVEEEAHTTSSAASEPKWGIPKASSNRHFSPRRVGSGEGRHSCAWPSGCREEGKAQGFGQPGAPPVGWGCSELWPTQGSSSQVGGLLRALAGPGLLWPSGGLSRWGLWLWPWAGGEQGVLRLQPWGGCGQKGRSRGLASPNGAPPTAHVYSIIKHISYRSGLHTVFVS